MADTDTVWPVGSTDSDSDTGLADRPLRISTGEQILEDHARTSRG